ncbi:MAG: membrane protein insertion efficiency factor YidD [Dehalococcoidia bacterium]|nr:membrane protein insertion efficiency factor YidD [Dehalococcoidia bacterium]
MPAETDSALRPAQRARRVRRRQSVTRLLLLCIRGYQRTVSLYLPSRCRYTPSCSEYAYEAIQRHGALRGLGLTLRRLARCRPGGGSGYDPVPEPRHRKAVMKEAAL